MAVTLDREALAGTARAAAVGLAALDVRVVALTWVDNAGVTRAKAIPLDRLAGAAAWGVGMSTVHDVFLVDDSITESEHIGGPVGDLRLHPDLDALTVLAAQPGWAWAPVDRWTQNGEAYVADQRQFAKRAVERAKDAGITMRMAFEIEWYLGNEDGTPAAAGPAYGMTRLIEVSQYAQDVLTALTAQGVPVEQFHPEYAGGQFEISVSHTDPVGAADMVVLVRETIRAVSLAHGWRASFAPVPVAGKVGNGLHLHFSAWSGDGNLFSGGLGPYGMTGRGESILAGILERMPALIGLTAPSVSSRLRRVPQRWAGAYQCWGLENREAALRFIAGVKGAGPGAANAELKCCDASANPYLVVGAVAAVAAASAFAELRLPAEYQLDPSTLDGFTRPPLLPTGVEEALTALAGDEVLCDALGKELLNAHIAVHRAEAELFATRTDDEIAEAVRWKY
ncbi:type I glutamate--ammonia ligase [Hamadaea tsunoensis]|uniref:glutamine synthetase family protein n=1 Tax=Hamadaea tsunoensis TaxID=53368 RepID=UPI00055830F6|nr:glutamine synthetase family protein [Hamadaea tsunoensis]